MTTNPSAQTMMELADWIEENGQSHFNLQFGIGREQRAKQISMIVSALRSASAPAEGREALESCRAFLVGMTKPSKVGPFAGVISSYHPCHALIDKIDTALAALPPIQEAGQGDGRAATIEECARAAEKAWPPAHTYTSENADAYRDQDHAVRTAVDAIRALASEGKKP